MTVAIQAAKFRDTAHFSMLRQEDRNGAPEPEVVGREMTTLISRALAKGTDGSGEKGGIANKMPLWTNPGQRYGGAEGSDGAPTAMAALADAFRPANSFHGEMRSDLEEAASALDGMLSDVVDATAEGDGASSELEEAASAFDDMVSELQDDFYGSEPGPLTCELTTSGDVTTRSYSDGTSISYDVSEGTATITLEDDRTLTLSDYDTTTQQWSTVTDSADPDNPQLLTARDNEGTALKDEITNYLDGHGFEMSDTEYEISSQLSADASENAAGWVTSTVTQDGDSVTKTFSDGSSITYNDESNSVSIDTNDGREYCVSIYDNGGEQSMAVSSHGSVIDPGPASEEHLNDYLDSHGFDLSGSQEENSLLEGSGMTELQVDAAKYDVHFGGFDPNAESDGIVSEFNQGGIGDCWFLSTVNALSQSAEGDNLIDEAITQTGEGTWEVTFGLAAGGDTYTYTVTEEEVNDARENGFDLGDGQRSGKISNGDFDMALLEVAAYKHYEEQQPDVANPMISGGTPMNALNLITGYSSFEMSQSSDYYNATGAANFDDAFLDELSNDPDGVNLTVAFYVDSNEEGKDRFAHSFTLTDVDSTNKTVTLENPWYTDEPIVLTYGQIQGKEPLPEELQRALRGDRTDWDMTYAKPVVQYSNSEPADEGNIRRDPWSRF